MSGRSRGDAFETLSFSIASIIKWLWSTLSAKTYQRYSRPVLPFLSMLEVALTRLKKTAMTSKTPSVNCGFQLFLKFRSYLEMRTLTPISNFGFLIFCSGLLYRIGKKSELFTFFGIKFVKHFLLDFSVVTIWVILWMYLYPLRSM